MPASRCVALVFVVSWFGCSYASNQEAYQERERGAPRTSRAPDASQDLFASESEGFHGPAVLETTLYEGEPETPGCDIGEPHPLITVPSEDLRIVTRQEDEDHFNKNDNINNNKINNISQAPTKIK